ncbi:hypothetical protein K788_0007047 (plasmid) [Paraburkholderia caribensis MBA4]|uniref:Response regulatory domain-containing protein n=1 Tax=Paraburkholderia caribensis MBA4 TaxID=1323664 RepID=A0A0N7JWE4_9BURK|nr:hypothetical protein [Paraburkholderia caribensis]ALL71781.1 hypothetical protein K788_0007047 [Paraburkholderia caribensis MBA4]
MANDIDSDSVGQAKAEFDVALRRLETAQRRLQALVANPGDDEAALQVARSAYDHARLLWLSSEAALRSITLVENQQAYAGWRIVILPGSSHVTESLAILLRLRGFRATVMSKHPAGLDRAVEPTAAVVADFDGRQEQEDELAVNRLRTSSATRMVAMVPAALQHHEWHGFDAVLPKPTTIDAIIRVILGHAHE